MTHVVYAIIDPIKSRIIYIGHTKNLEYRKEHHIDHGHGNSGIRIQEILDQGQKPVFVILEKCRTYAQSRKAEIFWIETFKNRGADLLNAENPHSKLAPNAYKPWTAIEDQKLSELYKAGTPVKKLAKYFQRTYSAIKYRIQHLKL